MVAVASRGFRVVKVRLRRQWVVVVVDLVVEMLLFVLEILDEDN